MKLIRYECPQNKSHSLNHLFNNFGMPAAKRFGDLFNDFWNSENDADDLAVNLYEDDDNYFARLELPGVKRDAINLELENSVLTCSGNYSEKVEDGESNFRFNRSVSIPDSVALNEISASYENGILTVKLPKKAETKPKQIKVQ